MFGELKYSLYICQEFKTNNYEKTKILSSSIKRSQR